MASLRCLIVDDEQDICDILEFYLERTGQIGRASCRGRV